EGQNGLNECIVDGRGGAHDPVLGRGIVPPGRGRLPIHSCTRDAEPGTAVALGAPFAPQSDAHPPGGATEDQTMRFLCFLFLVAFAGAVGAFAYFNREPVSLRFFEWSA